MVFPLGKMTFVPHFAELRASRSSIILTRACSLRVVPLLIASVVWVVFEKWDHRGTQGIHIKWSSRNRNMTIKHQIRNHDESWFYLILIMYMYGFKIYNKCLGAIQKMPSIEMGRPANEIEWNRPTKSKYGHIYIFWLHIFNLGVLIYYSKTLATTTQFAVLFQVPVCWTTQGSSQWIYDLEVETKAPGVDPSINIHKPIHWSSTGELHFLIVQLIKVPSHKSYPQSSCSRHGTWLTVWLFNIAMENHNF